LPGRLGVGCRVTAVLRWNTKLVFASLTVTHHLWFPFCIWMDL
jgi:hypothetical protein